MGMSNVSLYCANYTILSVRPFFFYWGVWVSIFFFKTDTECLDDVPLLSLLCFFPSYEREWGRPP